LLNKKRGLVSHEPAVKLVGKSRIEIEGERADSQFFVGLIQALKIINLHVASASASAARRRGDSRSDAHEISPMQHLFNENGSPGVQIQHVFGCRRLFLFGDKLDVRRSYLHRVILHGRSLRYCHDVPQLYCDVIIVDVLWWCDFNERWGGRNSAMLFSRGSK
jgi:hypothetical protein